MKLYLVDFENVKGGGLYGIERVAQEDHVVVLYTRNANTISIGEHLTLMHCACQIDFIELKQLGKNALDFQLVMMLGVMGGRYEDEDPSFFIISGDQGYDVVTEMNHIVGLDARITRCRTIAEAIDSEGPAKKEETSVNVINKKEETIREILTGTAYESRLKEIIEVVRPCRNRDDVHCVLGSRFKNDGMAIYKLIRPALSTPRRQRGSLGNRMGQEYQGEWTPEENRTETEPAAVEEPGSEWYKRTEDAEDKKAPEAAPETAAEVTVEAAAETSAGADAAPAVQEQASRPEGTRNGRGRRSRGHRRGGDYQERRQTEAEGPTESQMDAVAELAAQTAEEVRESGNVPEAFTEAAAEVKAEVEAEAQAVIAGAEEQAVIAEAAAEAQTALEAEPAVKTEDAGQTIEPKAAEEKKAPANTAENLRAQIAKAPEMTFSMAGSEAKASPVFDEPEKVILPQAEVPASRWAAPVILVKSVETSDLVQSPILPEKEEVAAVGEESAQAGPEETKETAEEGAEAEAAEGAEAVKDEAAAEETAAEAGSENGEQAEAGEALEPAAEEQAKEQEESGENQEELPLKEEGAPAQGGDTAPVQKTEGSRRRHSRRRNTAKPAENAETEQKKAEDPKEAEQGNASAADLKTPADGKEEAASDGAPARKNSRSRRRKPKTENAEQAGQTASEGQTAPAEQTEAEGGSRRPKNVSRRPAKAKNQAAAAETGSAEGESAGRSHRRSRRGPQAPAQSEAPENGPAPAAGSETAPEG